MLVCHGRPHSAGPYLEKPMRPPNPARVASSVAAIEPGTAWTGAADRPAAAAFLIDTVIDPGTRNPVVGMVRHAGHPFVGWVTQTQAGTVPDSAFWQLATAYLSALPAPARPDEAVLNPLRAKDARAHCFGWLDIGWGGPTPAQRQRHPHGSFWVSRRHGDDVIDRTLVLLAARRLHQRAMGGDIGLRVALHVAPADPAGRCRVQITGATFSCLALALVEVPPRYRPIVHSLDAAQALLGRMIDEIKLKLDFPAGALVLGVRAGAVGGVADDAQWLRLLGIGLRRRRVADDSPAPRARLYRFEVDIDAAAQLQRTVAIDELTAAGQAPGPGLFERDPASCGPAATLHARRPTRSPETLAACRVDLPRLGVQQSTRDWFLYEPERFNVQAAQPRGDEPRTVSTVNNAQTCGEDTVAVPLGQPIDLRSDDMAAAQAHLRAAELFHRLDAYGLVPGDYFRHARLPLVLRPRAAMRGAPGGEAVNAEVRPFWRGDLPVQWLTDAAPDAPDLRPQLLVRFGSADLMHRSALATRDPRHGDDAAPDYRQQAGQLQAGQPQAGQQPEGLHPGQGEGLWPGPPPPGLAPAGGAAPGPLTAPPGARAQTLGIAADPRWAWHEFGHVLAYASTGELEFAFAHSAGDALAAIATDPDSALAWDDDARFRTFPWVQTDRRHDRSARSGYCWCGRRNLPRLDPNRPIAHHQHGYFEEQILSSSLFRLYRCLGGDTRDLGLPAPERDVDDAGLPVRRSASDYCLYLIMRAISLLGPDSIAPARTPDQFVSALIDADLGTAGHPGGWTIQPDWPFRSTEPHAARRRSGARVHKVIRWAFEQQGLYASADPLAVVEGPGQPPAEDVYIADRRRTPPDGGYHPVALHWPTAGDTAWMADDSLRRQGRRVWLWVANRGQQPAESLRVRLWACAATADAPVWPKTDVPGRAAQGLDGAGAGRVLFEFALPPALAGQPVWLLANAHSPSDPGNLPLNDAPPDLPADLLELVAHDNNLAFALRQP